MDSTSILAYLPWNCWPAFCLWTFTALAEELQSEVVATVGFLELVCSWAAWPSTASWFTGYTIYTVAKESLYIVELKGTWVILSLRCWQCGNAKPKRLVENCVEYPITNYNVRERLVDIPPSVVMSNCHASVHLIWTLNSSGWCYGADNLSLICAWIASSSSLNMELILLSLLFARKHLELCIKALE